MTTGATRPPRSAPTAPTKTYLAALGTASRSASGLRSVATVREIATTGPTNLPTSVTTAPSKTYSGATCVAILSASAESSNATALCTVTTDLMSQRCSAQTVLSRICFPAPTMVRISALASSSAVMERCTVTMGQTKPPSSVSTARTPDSSAANSGADRFANSHSIGATGELIATTMRTSLLRLATTVHTRLSSDVLSRESRCAS